MRGMEIVAKSMERKEKARFRIRSGLRIWRRRVAPENSSKTEWLIVDVEMMGLRPPIRDKMFLRANRVLPYVLGRKGEGEYKAKRKSFVSGSVFQGNAFFKRGEMMKAVHEYKSCLKAISYVDDSNYLSALEGRMFRCQKKITKNVCDRSSFVASWKLGCSTFGVEELEKVGRKPLFLFCFVFYLLLRTIKYCSMVLEKGCRQRESSFQTISGTQAVSGQIGGCEERFD